MPLTRLTHGNTTWINVIQAAPADVQALGSDFPYIHPLNLEDLLSPIERPKLDLDEQYIFVVLHFPLWDPIQRLTRSREVDLIVSRGVIITAHDSSLKPLRQLFESCEKNEAERQKLLGKGAVHAFYIIIDQMVDYILPILRKVDGNIRNIEETIFTADPRSVIREITLVRRDIIALRRIIRQQVPVIEQLEKTDHPILHEDLEEYFGDIVDHLYKARDIIDEDAEVIAGLAETADILASHRINEVIRILTVISVIILPLTLISSIYGMNINLPFDEHPNAFTMLSAFMLMLGAAMLVYFHWRKWL